MPTASSPTRVRNVEFLGGERLLGGVAVVLLRRAGGDDHEPGAGELRARFDAGDRAVVVGQPGAPSCGWSTTPASLVGSPRPVLIVDDHRPTVAQPLDPVDGPGQHRPADGECEAALGAQQLPAAAFEVEQVRREPVGEGAGLDLLHPGLPVGVEGEFVPPFLDAAPEGLWTAVGGVLHDLVDDRAEVGRSV